MLRDVADGELNGRGLVAELRLGDGIERLRELSSSDEEFEAEAAKLLGADTGLLHQRG